jgi:hypothetical protein
VSGRPVPDWNELSTLIDTQGWAVMQQLLTAAECASLVSGFDSADPFRSRVVMARHGFGRGEYKYYRYPLPALIQRLRDDLYPGMACLANRWHDRMGWDSSFPATHREYLECCHRAGQRLPTPLLLKYGAGDYNCLHQDIYGEQVFPLQVAVLLSHPEVEFTGGEFVLTEQRPRMQSRVSVVPLRRGDAVAFAVRQRPVRGLKGDYRVTQRHGVSALRSGNRYTLGVIFHDASGEHDGSGDGA